MNAQVVAELKRAKASGEFFRCVRTFNRCAAVLVRINRDLTITTNGFSTGAIKDASQPDKAPMGLMNGELRATLLMEYNIGVRRMSHDLFELEKLSFAEKENGLENMGLK